MLSLLPADAAAQADAYIRAAVPAADATISGSFDRKSAAQLYMGCAQFGYFVSTFVRGVVLESDDAEGVANALKLASRQMRSEAAFVVASTRAGTLFELEREDASMGYEALREFTTRVQPISSAQKSELYAESRQEAPPTRPRRRRPTAAAAARRCPRQSWYRSTARRSRRC